MTFRNRVQIESHTGALLFVAQPATAQELIERGAIAWGIAPGGDVVIVRLSEGQLIEVDKRAQAHRPGSFGIQRETVEGSTVFSHWGCWGKRKLSKHETRTLEAEHSERLRRTHVDRVMESIGMAAA